jgi:hypothetical protein
MINKIQVGILSPPVTFKKKTVGGDRTLDSKESNGKMRTAM